MALADYVSVSPFADCAGLKLDDRMIGIGISESISSVYIYEHRRMMIFPCIIGYDNYGGRLSLVLERATDETYKHPLLYTRYPDIFRLSNAPIS